MKNVALRICSASMNFYFPDAGLLFFFKFFDELLNSGNLSFRCAYFLSFFLIIKLEGLFFQKNIKLEGLFFRFKI